jgi:hypothetical protein
MRIDFPDLEALNAKARRERAEAIYDLVVAPIAKLFTHNAPRHRVRRGAHRRTPA